MTHRPARQSCRHGPEAPQRPSEGGETEGAFLAPVREAWPRRPPPPARRPSHQPSVSWVPDLVSLVSWPDGLGSRFTGERNSGLAPHFLPPFLIPSASRSVQTCSWGDSAAPQTCRPHCGALEREVTTSSTAAQSSDRCCLSSPVPPPPPATKTSFPEHRCPSNYRDQRLLFSFFIHCVPAAYASC